MASDGMPIIGPVDSLEGFFISIPGCAFGVTTAPALGKIIADLIIDGRTDIIEIEQFLFSRFRSE
ncbi:MAG: FAD-binding oxidoreductase, partial [Candidatus Peribacteraceae bacterium]|nr:FAD-binding oxidoreductase [Candidatus Peribacteraceae bacterium]